MIERAVPKPYSVCLRILVLILICVAVLAPIGVGAQGPAPIAVDLRVGFDGVYRPAEWFPVIVEVTNNGPDIQATLEWRFSGMPGEQPFRRSIDLPRGAHKRITLEVFSLNVARNAQLRLLSNEVTLLKQDVQLESVDGNAFLIGVVSSDPALLNSLAALQLPNYSSVRVLHLRPTDLPEHTALLRSINALFLHDIDSSALNQAQRATLDRWVSLGGQLVVSGGATAQQTVAGLADLLPIERSGAIAQGDLSPLARFVGVHESQAFTAALNQVSPRPEAQGLPADAPLLFRWQRGGGSVTFSAFDFAALRTWGGESRLWSRLLEPIAIFAPGMVARRYQQDILSSVLRLPSLILPPISALLFFLLAYVIVIGPLNYLLLRRLRRLEWAWLSVPLTVVLFTVGLYVVGIELRGGRPRLSQIAVVQAAAGESRGFATAFIGLYSPRRTSYTLTLPGGNLVSEMTSRNGASSQPIFSRADSSDSSVELRDLLVDIGSVRSFVAESVVDLPMRVQISGPSDGAAEREVRNTGSIPLENLLLVTSENRFQDLGSLAPGESIRISEPTEDGFPWNVQLPSSGVFDRRQFLSELLGRDESWSGGANKPGSTASSPQTIMYLLMWSNQVSVPVRINGQEMMDDALTLYMIPLRP